MCIARKHTSATCRVRNTNTVRSRCFTPMLPPQKGGEDLWWGTVMRLNPGVFPAFENKLEIARKMKGRRRASKACPASSTTAPGWDIGVPQHLQKRRVGGGWQIDPTLSARLSKATSKEWKAQPGVNTETMNAMARPTLLKIKRCGT